MKKTFFITLLYLLLTSCTAHNLFGTKAIMSDSDEDHYSCIDYGFTPGTQGYARCRIRLDDNRHHREIIRENQEHRERLVNRSIDQISEMQERELRHKEMLEAERFNRNMQLNQNRIRNQDTRQQTTPHNESFSSLYGNLQDPDYRKKMNCKKNSRGETICSRFCSDNICGASPADIKRKKYNEQKLRAERKEQRRKEVLRKREERQRLQKESRRKRDEARTRLLQERALKRCKRDPHNPKCKRACFKNASGVMICG